MGESDNPAFRARLETGLTALSLPLEVDKTNKLLAFIALLQKWNKAYNLTAIRDPEVMLTLHLLDSLAIQPYLKGTAIIDIGTGAGLPGLPLAIYNPDRHFVLLDSNAKKTRFVQQVVIELGLDNVEVHHARVESFNPETLFETVLCRAFADLQTIFNLSQHLLSETGCILAMKGQHPTSELERLMLPYSVISIIIPGVDTERCLIQINAKQSHE